VSSVSPGFVETPLVDDYFKGREQELAAVKASLQMLTAEDVAREVVHIAEAPLHVEIGGITLRSAEQKD